MDYLTYEEKHFVYSRVEEHILGLIDDLIENWYEEGEFRFFPFYVTAQFGFPESLRTYLEKLGPKLLKVPFFSDLHLVLFGMHKVYNPQTFEALIRFEKRFLISYFTSEFSSLITTERIYEIKNLMYCLDLCYILLTSHMQTYYLPIEKELFEKKVNSHYTLQDCEADIEISSYVEKYVVRLKDMWWYRDYSNGLLYNSLFEGDIFELSKILFPDNHYLITHIVYLKDEGNYLTEYRNFADLTLNQRQKDMLSRMIELIESDFTEFKSQFLSFANLLKPNDISLENLYMFLRILESLTKFLYLIKYTDKNTFKDRINAFLFEKGYYGWYKIRNTKFKHFVIYKIDQEDSRRGVDLMKPRNFFHEWFHIKEIMNTMFFPENDYKFQFFKEYKDLMLLVGKSILLENKET